ncbi:MAG: hypothetical protein IKB86_08700 [Clostridia bacterium]|nr:hypothetical protein [Clostridia bacterium]
MGNFIFKPEAFVDSLQYMGKGMLGIIIVIGIIILTTVLINYFTGEKVSRSKKILFVSALCLAIIFLSAANTIRIDQEKANQPETPPTTDVSPSVDEK